MTGASKVKVAVRLRPLNRRGLYLIEILSSLTLKYIFRWSKKYLFVNADNYRSILFFTEVDLGAEVVVDMQSTQTFLKPPKSERWAFSILSDWLAYATFDVEFSGSIKIKWHMLYESFVAIAFLCGINCCHTEIPPSWAGHHNIFSQNQLV